MSPRHAFAVAVPLTLALGLGAAAVAPASAMTPPEDQRQRIVNAPSVHLGQLPEHSIVGDGGVYAVEQLGDTVYALGGFTRLGHYSGPGRILDATTGADRAAPVFGDGQVSVALADGAGGWFLGGDVRDGVVHVLADGSVDPAFNVETSSWGLVSAIARVGDTLYIGGLFDTVNGIDRKNLAAVSATSGNLLPFTANTDRRVTELAADGDTLWMATGKNVVSLDTSGVPLTSTSFSSEVRGLAVGDGMVYVGEDGLAAIDPVTGGRLGGFTDAVVDGTVHTLLLDGDRLYVGTDGTDGSSQLIAVDPATGAKDASFAAEVHGGFGTFDRPGGVFDLALDGDRLWAAGAFSGAGEAKGNLAVLDAATGDVLDVAVPSFHEQVNAVEISGGAAYVGGHFYLDDLHRTAGLAALDAETLEPRPDFRARGLRSYGGLTVAPNALYVAPTHFLGYTPRKPYYWGSVDSVDAFDPATGAPDPKRSQKKIKNLTGLTVLGDRLVIAQRLQDDVKFPANRITVFAPSGKKAWSFKVPLKGYITNLAVVDGDLLVAGSFKRTSANGGPRNTALIRLDARTGERRAYFDPHIHGPVNDLSVMGSSIYATGLFTKVFSGLSQDRPGLVKLNARSAKSEQFVPDITGGSNWTQRAIAIGPGLVWSDGAQERFLDATTGERVQLDAMPDDLWLYDVTGDADTVVLGGRDIKGLAGQGYHEIGFLTAIVY